MTTDELIDVAPLVSLFVDDYQINDRKRLMFLFLFIGKELWS